MQVRKLASRDIYRKKRVAAYARVSTMQECQEDSFETQVKYYESLIKGTPNWKFTKVYADHGFSGVSAENRPGYMEMVRDAKCKEFDILLVRSISRFARNVKEAQIYCRELKANGIEVRFEKERVSSLDATAELAFNLLASCAQEESRATSERTKWGVHKLQEQGILHIGDRLLGYEEVAGELTPDKEAWVVKKIFELYADGETSTEIASYINRTGFRRDSTLRRVDRRRILEILRNPTYVGDRLLQKQAPKNYLTHKPDQLQAYQSHYIKNTHEGIVSRELWDAVQSRLERADELTSFGTQCRTDSHFLYGKVFCGICGHPMKRKMVNSGRPCADGSVDKIAVWKCADRLKGSKGNGCKNDILKEDDLIERVCCELGINESELEKCAEQIDRIIVTGGEIEVFTFAEKEA